MPGQGGHTGGGKKEHFKRADDRGVLMDSRTSCCAVKKDCCQRNKSWLIYTVSKKGKSCPLSQREI